MLHDVCENILEHCHGIEILCCTTLCRFSQGFTLCIMFQVEIDDSRHVLYTLSDKGTVTVYDLENDGKGTSRVLSVPHNHIMNAAVQVAK